MALPEQASFWTTKAPSAWPDAPAEMTVTTLAEIEACPRRWTLGAAEYPGLWTGRGYPPRVQLSTLAGTVVHLALEETAKGLAQAGCPSVQDSRAYQVLRELGGYTKVVNDCIDRVLERLASSPRTKHFLEFASRSLHGCVPELRTRTQTILCRVRLPQVGVSHTDGHTSKLRRSLALGVFPEIELRARRIGWKGKADLLVLSPRGCEITDFKTGEPDDGHRFQIQVYALLWSRDTDLNPDGRLADRLVLAYSSGDVEVPAPTAPELDAIENHIVARRDAACQAVSLHPPEVRPDPDHCRSCGVRQLCNEYWTVEAQRRLAEGVGDRRFADIEVMITERHGPSSWDAQVVVSGNAPAGKLAVLRTRGDVEFRIGDRIRVIDAAVTVDGEDMAQPVVITLGVLTETYAVV